MANTRNKDPAAAEIEVFDAAKHAKAPSHLLANPPLPFPAVRIGIVSSAIGYGLFAARDLAAGEFIFHEAPLMTARFNERFSADAALVASQVAACRGVLFGGGGGGGRGRDRDRDRDRDRERDRDMDRDRVGMVAAVAFPALTARFGMEPVGFETAGRVLGVGTPARGEEGGMGMNLVRGQGMFAGSNVTREEYEAYTSRFAASAGVTEAEAREACLDFFKHYAFQVYGPGDASGCGDGRGASRGLAAATREACVYLLGSLINHCCTPCSSFLGNSSSTENGSNTGPNCSWRIGPSGLAQFIKPRHICVQARRPIHDGEQLTWDYGKREKGFVCECDICQDSLIGGLGSMCGML
ncbi:SET domain-containing protein [Parathielavia appendiculata]|uniref:SET domain-containing protein n=1 Tax=Parathielavia appendiculata TaxID=2587402 RepID=A0AAN6U7A8_9PEZI|nr:SET domain-containing protein [Parathielavia appendiculata]